MSITLQRRTFRIAELGRESELPMLGRPLENPYTLADNLPAEIVESSRYGNPSSLYPYRLQDNYSRTLAARELPVVVLENDHLRASVLPGLGGRLWSLWDKAAGKELLHSPQTVQFANLGLRDAWFAGGIEFNIGTRGHSPTTCAPLHTALVTLPDGREVLRMWEFERMRGVIFRIELWLPEDSKALLTAMSIVNPSDADVPMYWWTNAAVPQQAGSRVLAPAETAYATDYANGIARVDPRAENGVDATWPINSPRARDYFFDIAPDRQPWVMNVDPDGDGLAMLSTSRLRGRKLFVWGTGAGGRHWQHWLSPDGENYAEIQAGLAQTQFQHLRLPGGERWSWVEAYGNAHPDVTTAHGDDWAAAVAECGRAAEDLCSAADLEAALADHLARWDVPPDQVWCRGSGWGAVEEGLRSRSGRSWPAGPGTPFDGAASASEQPWLDLLAGRKLGGTPGFAAGREWLELLGTDSAVAVLHGAVIAHSLGEHERAAAGYRALLDAEQAPAELTAHAHRGLALLAADPAAAADHYELACAARPQWRTLLVEAARHLLGAAEPRRALRLLDAATGDLAADGRIVFLRAEALAGCGEIDAAATLLRAGIVVPDLREGEVSLAELWRRVRPGEPVPAEYEFDMGGEAATPDPERNEA